MFKKNNQYGLIHGLTKHPLFTIWSKIKQRCYNKKHKSYKYYGNKGIKLYNNWLNNFQNFYDWSIKQGWKKELELDRKDNNGNYEPNNCRFVNHKINCRNKSNNKLITYNNKTQTLIEWSEETKINRRTISYRLKNKWPIEKVFSTPVNYRSK